MVLRRGLRRQTMRYGKIARSKEGTPVKTMLLFVVWCLLLVLCWPLAILAIFLWPLVWLVSLPFRLVGISIEALFALLRAILFLPARVLGYRDTSARRPS
jgi:hypothetical protein